MQRLFALIVILAFASAGAAAAGAHAQSRRVWRAEPPKEERRDEKSEKKDEAKDEAKGEAKDEQQQPSQDGARAGGGNDEPAASKEVTTRAIIKSKPNPAFTHEARLQGVRGRVKLRIILGSDGKVRDRMEVLEGLPYGITEQAMKAARRIKFEPARKDGRPVSQYVIVVYNFNLY